MDVPTSHQHCTFHPAFKEHGKKVLPFIPQLFLKNNNVLILLDLDFYSKGSFTDKTNC